MLKGEQLPFNPDDGGHVQRTALRHNLANATIESSDTIISYPDIDTKLRLIQYHFDHSKQSLFYDLLAKKLILGDFLPNASETNNVFSTPIDARPIKFEAGALRQGEFTYGDQRLFKELGSLLAITNKVSGGLVLPLGSISMSVAFIDFTRPDEHNLFLIPGIERLLVPTDINAQTYYESGLARDDEMGARFHPMAAQEFSRSFNKVYYEN